MRVELLELRGVVLGVGLLLRRLLGLPPDLLLARHMGHEQLVLLLLVEAGARLCGLGLNLDGLRLEPRILHRVDVLQLGDLLVDELLPPRLPVVETLRLALPALDQILLLLLSVLDHPLLFGLEDHALLLLLAHQKGIGLVELGAQLLLLLALHLAHRPLLLQVGHRHRLHKLALAPPFRELGLELLPALIELPRAKASELLTLPRVLSLSRVLLGVHPADRLLLLLVPALFLHLGTRRRRLLDLELRLTLLQHVTQMQLAVEGLDTVGGVVEHLVGPLDHEPSLLGLQSLLLAINCLAHRLFGIKLLLAHPFLLFTRRL
mmetsp:Transcript_2739/g.5635  ORF Transcript_2739/g.5635 Transcript_2739/m.5635 type:complete len:320 (+) Transcript_2739:876-1835(+)